MKSGKMDGNVLIKPYELSEMDTLQVDDYQLQMSYHKNFPEKVCENDKQILRMLSLFSGCGGMDLGFEGDFFVHKNSVNLQKHPDFVKTTPNNQFVKLKKTKFITKFANDILPEAKNAWANYFKKSKTYEDVYHVESIVDLVKAHMQGAEIFPENIDLVTGGFPCQDFSIAGKRNGFSSHKNHKGEKNDPIKPNEETRGKLYMWMKEVIEITKPKIFVAENVKGLVNLQNVKEIIQSDFSSAGENGYIVLDPKVLHAADYGIPQSRERVIFIGIRKSSLLPDALKALSGKEIPDLYNPYPEPSHSYTKSGNDLIPPVKLKDVFSGLAEPEFSDDPSHKHYSKAKYMGSHCQGQTEIKPDGISPTIRAEHHGNIEYRRLAQINGGKNIEELNKGLLERRLTPRECALIQTFPSDYELVIPHPNGNKRSFLVSPSKAYKLIGNAVPPLLAYHIARRLEEIWPLYFSENQ